FILPFLLSLTICPSTSAVAAGVEMGRIVGRELPRFAIARLGNSRFAHGTLINDVYWMPDGHRILSFGSNGDSVAVWNATSGESSIRIRPEGTASFSGGNVVLIRNPPKNGTRTQ